MRILLIDDEEELAATLSERLNLRGIEAKWAISDTDALKLLRAERFDLVVLDVKMPKLSGFDLKNRIAEEFSYMKFIFLTGYASEKGFERVSKELGEGCYLLKPVNIDILIARINNILIKGDMNRGKNDKGTYRVF